MQTSKGNFPTMANENKMTADCKVHWCNGAPGAIPTFLSAATLFNSLGLKEKAD